MARIIDAFTQIFDNSGNPLVNGKLRFLESGTSNTDKTTFKDAAMTAGLENTNPVILDGAGRLAFSVFGSGVYNVILFTSDDVQIQQFDPVGASLTSGQFVSWSPSETYDEGDIRRGSDGEYYQSVDNDNSNNNPITSPDDWDLITIVKSYVANATGTGDVITADFVPVIHALEEGIRVLVSASAANSSTVPTFAPNGLTAKVIVKHGNDPLIAGDISAALFAADMVYRAGIDKWELLNPSGNPTSITVDNIIAFDANGNSKDSLVQIQREANAGGSADVLTATFSPTLPSPLIDKVQVKVRALLANATSTPTFNGDTIVKNGDQPLAAGDIFGLGHILIMDYNLANTNWELLNPSNVSALSANNMIHIQDQKTAGTNGGTFTSGSWVVRDLNTVLTNTIIGASLSVNNITLPIGTYYIEASAPANGCDSNATRLFNATDTAVTLSGENSLTDSTIDTVVKPSVYGLFAITAIKLFELQHRCGTTQPTNGLGVSINAAVPVPHETYSDVKIWKVG